MRSFAQMMTSTPPATCMSVACSLNSDPADCGSFFHISDSFGLNLAPQSEHVFAKTLASDVEQVR